MTGRQIMATLQDELARRDAALHYRVRDEVYTQLGDACQVVADKMAADITDQLRRQMQAMVDHINAVSAQLQASNQQLLRLLKEIKSQSAGSAQSPTREDER